MPDCPNCGKAADLGRLRRSSFWMPYRCADCRCESRPVCPMGHYTLVSLPPIVGASLMGYSHPWGGIFLTAGLLLGAVLDRALIRHVELRIIPSTR